MTTRYSPYLGVFYPTEIEYPALPEDIIEVPRSDMELALGCLPSQVVTVVEGRLVLAPKPEDIEASRAAARNRVNAARAEANQGTFEFSGKAISCDALSRSDIDGTNGYVSLTGAMPPGWPGAWKTADNSFVSIPDVPTWKAFYGSMVQAGQLNYAKAQSLKAAIEAAGSVADVEAIQW